MPRYFPKGVSGNPGGRPKGLKVQVYKILAEKGCCPFTVLADLALNANSPKVRCEAASELAQYIAPKLKSIEHIGDNENPLIITLNLKDMTVGK